MTTTTLVHKRPELTVLVIPRRMMEETALCVERSFYVTCMYTRTHVREREREREKA